MKTKSNLKLSRGTLFSNSTRK